MKSYKLHPDAKSRIDDIWQYTYRNWGKKQADRYIFNIEDRIKKICSNEVVGRIYKPLEDYNVQYISCYRHYVFYQEDESTVFVLTVLHDVMDLPSRVKDVLNQK